MKQKKYIGIYCFVISLCFCSCGTYRVVPPLVEQVCTHKYSIENMDKTAIVEIVPKEGMVAHYEGFDIKYYLNENKILVFDIENKTNKSLIIDKAKCFVLYDGYASNLFKDIRQGRSVVYNNVQDAITNVQTGESSVNLQIPPYSKWTLSVPESNVRSIKLPPETERIYTVFDAVETIEFIITFSYDYSLSKWNEARNRMWIGETSITLSNSFRDGGTIEFVEKTMIEKKDIVQRYQHDAAVEHNNMVSANREAALLWSVMGGTLVVTGLIYYLLFL